MNQGQFGLVGIVYRVYNLRKPVRSKRDGRCRRPPQQLPEHGFPMIEVEWLPLKRRRHSMILMSEVGIPLRVTEDLIEIAASLIDYVRITDHVSLSDRLAAMGKKEFLLFELGLIQPQEKATWLVERYGSEINFTGVAPADVVAVDAIHRGIHRQAGYRAMVS